MDPALAIFLLVFGIPGAIWPYQLARFEEQFDSIGSKRSWSEVEPADWKVTVTRFMGVGMTFFGAMGLITS